MILEYVKGFLTLFLLIKVLLYFVPKNAFEKYIAFFSGVILVIGMLYPLLQAFGKEEVVLEKLQYEAWEEQLLEISADAARLEEAGTVFLQEQYREVESAGYEQDRIVIETVKIGSTQEGDEDE